MSALERLERLRDKIRAGEHVTTKQFLEAWAAAEIELLQAEGQASREGDPAWQAEQAEAARRRAVQRASSEAHAAENRRAQEVGWRNAIAGMSALQREEMARKVRDNPQSYSPAWLAVWREMTGEPSTADRDA